MTKIVMKKTIAVACTTCGAAAGELCRRPGGQLYAMRFFMHKARRVPVLVPVLAVSVMVVAAATA